MVRVLPVLHILGFMIMILAGFMTFPLLVSLWMGDGAASAYHQAILVTGVVGMVLWAATRHLKQELQTRDGFLLVSLVWTVLPAFAMLPLLIYIPGLSVTD